MMKELLKGFTLLEVMVSIFIFSSGMLAYMAYHSKVNSMVFDNESSKIAHSLALNLAEEMMSMSSEDYYELSKDKENGNSIWMDNILFDSDENMAGPFDSRGKPGSSGDKFQFYRFIRFSTYDIETDTYNPAPSLYGKLRHFDIIVAWPFKQYGEHTNKCGDSNYITSNSNIYCNFLSIPVVRFAEY